MIHRVSSTLPTFKTLRFHEGLNVLVADKSPGATDLQTRNAAGKSSLVELLHFVLGADADQSSLFRTPELAEHTFRLDFVLAGQNLSVARSGATPNEVVVIEADVSEWPVKPSTNLLGERTLTKDEWLTVLGERMFGLQARTEPFSPTFRALFPYFARRERAGGFVEPSAVHRQQQQWQKQVAIYYFFGLDWTIPQAMQGVRRRKKVVRDLRELEEDGQLGDVGVHTTLAQLRTQLTITDARVRRLKQNLAHFKVVPEYHELEAEANDITQKLNRLADESTMDREVCAELEGALADERPPGFEDLERMYREAGVVVNDAALRRFDEVKAFHESVVQNRRAYLSGELDAARTRVARREAEMRQLGERSAQIMEILRTSGALETFTQLQEELSRATAAREALGQRVQRLDEISRSSLEISIEENNLKLRLKQDQSEQATALERAILTFQETSAELYENAGVMEVSDSLTGSPIKVNIHGQASAGVSNMQIFCFDIMLMRFMQERRTGPGFLVHDSHLFDPVDARQFESALQIGQEAADEFAFQYLVTANTDDLEKLESFDWGKYELTPRLTDARENGGLFGIRFG